MRELSLFTGAGGGLLGTQLLGWQHVGYVEFDDYRKQLIRQRIDDGILHNAPIFGDIQTFIREGYAAGYTGLVDVITAGFPCQPFSQMGKCQGSADHRNMWPATVECIGIIRPRFVFLENVPNLISIGYIGTIIADLDTLGYVGQWDCIPASAIGAPHRRDRLWCYAADTSEVGLVKNQFQIRNHSAKKIRKNDRPWQPTGVANLENPNFRVPESGLLRTRDGIPHWVDRIKATGDGQVPAVAAAAWQILTS